MRKYCYCTTPAGNFILLEAEGKLSNLWFPGENPGIVAELCPQSPLLQQATVQLQEYLAGQRREFTLPLAASGTVFQQLVWQELQRIPYGQCISYGQLARRLGRPGASRAVGRANHCNPLPIFIPCHRVIKADGSQGGFRVGGAWKERLLALEAAGKAAQTPDFK
ncbi:MAG: methylated-DNA--[protein]-cysteine S-methyltransferase [Lentisphaerae bacterium]|jgi:methylated-DNA-[protein]-cysteine S-methyltransferase|nr:methylated-DNA--[protein]-cysteine S-methyltransferase [Lentisphaerota bacterium]